jgi:hypothetical protein
VGRADELCSIKIKFSSTFELSGVRFCRPMLQHARPLPDAQPNARPVLDGRRKTCCAFARLPPAYSMRSTQPALVHFSAL